MKKQNQKQVSIKYSKACEIIPAKDGMTGFLQADVVVVETKETKDGKEIVTNEIFDKEGNPIGKVENGVIKFDEEYKKKLEELLPKKIFEDLKLDDRKIKLDEILEKNTFEELALESEIEGLKKEEIIAILKRHLPPEEVKKIEEKLAEKEPREPEPKSIDEQKEVIARDINVDDPSKIISIETIKDNKACEILESGENKRGYPKKIKLEDGRELYVKFDDKGKYEEVKGLSGEGNEGEYTDYINSKGVVEKCLVKKRVFNRSNPKEAISTIEIGGEEITVIERMAGNGKNGVASVSREMVTDGNEERHKGGTIEKLVDEMPPDKIKEIDEEVDEKVNENPGDKIHINELETVEEKYKKGLDESEDEERSLDEEDKDEGRTRDGDAWDSRMRGVN